MAFLTADALPLGSEVKSPCSSKEREEQSESKWHRNGLCCGKSVLKVQLEAIAASCLRAKMNFSKEIIISECFNPPSGFEIEFAYLQASGRTRSTVSARSIDSACRNFPSTQEARCKISASTASSTAKLTLFSKFTS